MAISEVSLVRLRSVIEQISSTTGSNLSTEGQLNQVLGLILTDIISEAGSGTILPPTIPDRGGDSAEQIRDKLQTLTGDDRLSESAIRDIVDSFVQRGTFNERSTTLTLDLSGNNPDVEIDLSYLNDLSNHIASENIDIGGQEVVNSGRPTTGSSLTNRDYVDSMVALGRIHSEPVLDKDLLAPPSSPSSGDRYIVAGAGGTSSGDWVGQETNIAERSPDNSEWTFTSSANGLTVTVIDEQQLYVYESNSLRWISQGGISNHNSLSGIQGGSPGDYNHISSEQLLRLLNTETGTQLNARDTANRDRANHTGTQTSSTISDFDSSVSSNAAVQANTSKVSNVESDWNESDPLAESFIRNKPVIPVGSAPQFSSILGNPEDNTLLSAALLGKVNVSDLPFAVLDIRPNSNPAQNIPHTVVGVRTEIVFGETNNTLSSDTQNVYFSQESGGLRVMRSGLCFITASVSIHAAASPTLGGQRIDPIVVLKRTIGGSTQDLGPRGYGIYARNGGSTQGDADKSGRTVTVFGHFEQNTLIGVDLQSGDSILGDATLLNDGTNISGIFVTPQSHSVQTLPSFSSFNVDIPIHVPAGTTISGNHAFSWSLLNSESLTGMLTVLQDGSIISSVVDKDSSPQTLGISSVTLTNVGDTSVFVIRNSASTISRTYTVTAQTQEEFVYFGRSTSNNPNNIDLSTLTAVRIGSVGQQINVPFEGIIQGDTFMVLYPDNISFSVENLSAPGQSAFDEFSAVQENVRTENGQSYDTIVQTPLIAGVNPTYRITINNIA